MKLSFVLISLFALIVFIIPITTLTRHANTVEPVIKPSSSQAAPPPIWSSSTPSSSEAVPPPGTEEDEAETSAAPSSPASVPDKKNNAAATTDIIDTKYFNILNTATGKVNKVHVKDYVRGALASEMPATFHIEAMKAQAVSAHTYALRNKQIQALNPDPKLKGADFSADPDDLKGYISEKQAKSLYGGQFEFYWNKICDAADSTLDMVMAYEGEPILAAYHSTSTGITEDASNVWLTSVPYLVPVESEGDILSPSYQTEVVFSPDEIEKKFKAKYDDVKFPADKTKWFEVLERSEGGYITLIDAGGLTLHGKDVRTVLGLKSSSFEVVFKNNQFIFTTTGYGHGVGLSQYGADYMARQGSTYDEILTHYYSGAELTQVSPK